MSIRANVGETFSRAVRRAVVESRSEDLRHRNVDLAVERLLREVPIAGVNDICQVASFLRGCVEPLRAAVEVLAAPADDAPASDTFRALLGSMDAVPPIAAAAAVRLALYADAIAGLSGTVASRLGVAQHAALSSSAGFKGRLLAAAARALQPARVLELGTAYGIGTAFLVAGVPAEARVVTIEMSEPQATIARESLRRHLDGRVHCLTGPTRTQIPEATRLTGGFDLVFHDAGHRGDDYRGDFGALVDAMAPGSLFMLDDIRWDDPRFCDGPSGAYEGWREVSRHPRVAAAAEIAGEIGLLLLR
jgi:predicted O-methyltransferase YrrM